MNKKELYSIMQEINAAYGNKKFPLSEEILGTWFKYLAPCDCEVLKGVLERYIKQEAFPPAIAELLSGYRSIVKEKEEEKERITDSYHFMLSIYPGAQDDVETREAFYTLIKSINENPIRIAREICERVSGYIRVRELEGARHIPPLKEFLEKLGDIGLNTDSIDIWKERGLLSCQE